MRVHPELLQTEGLERSATTRTNSGRSAIAPFAGLSGTSPPIMRMSLKFFLHLSKEEQRKRFLARIDEPEKNWKFSQADMAERGYWDDYRHAYEVCLSETSAETRPGSFFPPTTSFRRG